MNIKAIFYDFGGVNKIVEGIKTFNLGGSKNGIKRHN